MALEDWIAINPHAECEALSSATVHVVSQQRLLVQRLVTVSRSLFTPELGG
jgi:hypothetical protein